MGKFYDASLSAHTLASSTRQKTFGSGAGRPVTIQWADSFEFSPSTPRPLFLLLHGRGDTASNMQGTWGLQFLRNNVPGGALVLAPSGASDGGTLAWNASNSCCWTGGGAPDDVAYLGGLIDEVLAASPSWNVDPDQIYVIGHSNGGFMAIRLACEREDLIAAVWDLAGAGPSATDTACTLSEPVTFLHVHGTNDTTIAPAGGTFAGMGQAYIAVEGTNGTLDKLGDANGCSGALTLTTAEAYNHDSAGGAGGNETDEHDIASCPAHGGVKYWEMNGSGHIPTYVLPGWADDGINFLLANPKP